MEHPKYKNPFLSMMLTTFIPGFGQIYSGYWLRGFIFAVLELCLLVIFLLMALSTAVRSSWPFIILFFVTFAAGFFIWVDAFLCARRSNKKRGVSYLPPLWMNAIWVMVVFLFSIIWSPVMDHLVGAYIVQSFQVKAEDMADTIKADDYVFIDKRAGYHQIFQRGDVVFLKKADQLLVMRIAAMSGDVVEIKAGRLYIHNVLVEALPFNKITYVNGGNWGGVGQKFVVPQNQYYLLGDNPSNTQDSRYIGFVPDTIVLGKVIKIFLPFNRAGVIQ